MFAGKSSAPSRRGLGFWLFCGLVAAAGCGGADTRPAKWSFIAPAIIEPTCATASCHSEVAKRAGVVLAPKDAAFHTLVDRQFVRPMDAAESEMVILMRGIGSQRMPPDYPLAEADIELIEKWIDDGAKPD